MDRKGWAVRSPPGSHEPRSLVAANGESCREGRRWTTLAGGWPRLGVGRSSQQLGSSTLPFLIGGRPGFSSDREVDEMRREEGRLLASELAGHVLAPAHCRAQRAPIVEDPRSVRNTGPPPVGGPSGSRLVRPLCNSTHVPWPISNAKWPWSIACHKVNNLSTSKVSKSQSDKELLKPSIGRASIPREGRLVGRSHAVARRVIQRH